MNSVVLSGRLTKELELRRTNSNKAVVSGTIAVQRDKEHADFVEFTAWENLAESLANNTTKGSRIVISGQLQSRTYESKEGSKVTVWEVVVRNAEIIDFKEKEEKVEEEIITDDDLPF